MRGDPSRTAARAFAWLCVLGFCYLPVLVALWVSPHLGQHPVSPPASLGRTFALTGNTAIVSGGAALFALAVGLPYGLLVARTDLPLRRFFEAVLLVPLLMPPYVAGTGWVYATGSQGFLNTSAASLIRPGVVSSGIFPIAASTVVLGLSYMPLVALAAASAARQTSRELEDVARLSAERWSVVRHSVLPFVMPSSVAAAGLVFLLSAADFGVPALFSVNVLTVEVYEQFAAYYNTRAAVLAMLPLIGIAVAGLLLSTWIYRAGSRSSVDSDLQKPRVWRLGWWRPAAAVFCASSLGGAVLIPVLALLRETQGTSAFAHAWAQGTTEIWHTAAYAFWAACVATLMAIPVGYFAARGKAASTTLFRLLVLLAVAVPGGILGVGLISLLNRPGFADYIYTGAGIVVIGFVCRFMPVTSIVLAAGIGQVSTDLEDPARVAGAGWFGVLRAAVLPYIRPWLLVAWLATFALCTGELATSVLVSPPGCETLPVKVFSLMHFGASSVMAALCLIVVAMALAPVIVAVVLFWFLSTRSFGMSKEAIP